MSRALLVLLLTFLSQANALEYVRQIRLNTPRYNIPDYDRHVRSLVEVQMPGDSDLVVDSTKIGTDSVRIFVHVVSTTGRSDSIWYLRHILPNSKPAVICLAASEADCLQPRNSVVFSDLFYNGMGDCFPRMEHTHAEGNWGLGSALASLQKHMNSVEDWAVFRAEEVTARTIGVWGANPFPDRNMKDWYWESPWNRLDSLVGQGQWHRAEKGFKGGKGDTFVFLAAYPWHWKIRSGVDTSSSLKVLGDSFLTAPSYLSSCDPKSASADTRRLLTGKGGSYAIVEDSVQLDTLLKINTNQYGIDSIVLRARIALKDLDSLLRNPPAVGITSTPARPSPLHISRTHATLEAGASFGRLELVDARGQILSKITGTGRLTLDTRGHGLRWLRWTRGPEQGAQAVLL